MEAARFLPGTRQLLSILADGLPHSTAAFINLYDSIIYALNEPNEKLLPSIHHLLDRIVNIDNNIQRTRLLHPPPRRRPPATSVVHATVAPSSAATGPTAGTQSTVPHCSNCNRPGHMDKTCFQPGGGMEGRREE
jgi:hypothetical protein